jgi:hypothetical protein
MANPCISQQLMETSKNIKNVEKTSPCAEISLASGSHSVDGPE